jgi:hypothetical protein
LWTEKILGEENVGMAVAVEVARDRTIARSDLSDALERPEGKLAAIVDKDAALKLVGFITLGLLELRREYTSSSVAFPNRANVGNLSLMNGMASAELVRLRSGTRRVALAITSTILRCPLASKSW